MGGNPENVEPDGAGALEPEEALEQLEQLEERVEQGRQDVYKRQAVDGRERRQILQGA